MPAASVWGLQMKIHQQLQSVIFRHPGLVIIAYQGRAGRSGKRQIEYGHKYQRLEEGPLYYMGDKRNMGKCGPVAEQGRGPGYTGYEKG